MAAEAAARAVSTDTPGAGRDFTPAMFREAFRTHPAGVVVIAADAGEGPVALTATSLISVSAEPPAVAFSLSASSSSAATIRRAVTVVVHFIRTGDRGLAERCASRDVDRFGPTVAWERLATGEPRFIGVSTWFRARIVGELEIHGSTLVVAEPLEGEVSVEARAGWVTEQPMVYSDRKWRVLGAAIGNEAPGLFWEISQDEATF